MFDVGCDGRRRKSPVRNYRPRIVQITDRHSSRHLAIVEVEHSFEPRVAINRAGIGLDQVVSYTQGLAWTVPRIQKVDRTVHRRDKGLNNRAENSHQPTRERERRMRGFKSTAHAQRFLSIFGVVADLFGVGRHLLSASNYRMALSRRFIEWRSIIGVLAAA